jgi:glycosyltransferase involved in cell wall biosynthesis
MTNPGAQIIVVIPCYNEPDVMLTIQSLFDCDRGDFGVEIILVVNSYIISPEAIKAANRLAFQTAESFASANNTPAFSLFPILVENFPGHQTGAGFPRKTGMDEAVRRFNERNNTAGIIVSLDADTTVEKNYLTEIYRCFKKYKLRSATIEFHHPVEHLNPEDAIRKATEIYEKYLRYYRAALEYTGFPYAYYTIGSAFAVTAETYSQVGGMGKHQAGEDFYFLQKVFPLGKTRFIDTTCVYPAARVSDRVPFGTGPALARMVEEKKFIKYTYCMEAFEELKQFFSQINSFYQAEETEKLMDDFPVHLRAFLEENDFLAKIAEIKRNTTNPESFRKRFFRYFTAFRILKYLNSVHPVPFPFAVVTSEFEPSYPING